MRYIVLFLAFFSAVGAFAQDQLFKKDNSKTDVKILEVTPNEIKYKLFTYQDGPTITVLKSEVALIIYQNGTHETFNTPPPAAQSQPVLIYAADPARAAMSAHAACHGRFSGSACVPVKGLMRFCASAAQASAARCAI